MEITYAISTSKGDRGHNEDYALAGRNGDVCCFVVADGLGGHGKGAGLPGGNVRTGPG